MNNKKKSVLYITGVFILGVFIGFLINMTLMERRIENFRKMGRPQGMTKFIERTLELTENQKEKVKEIFDEFELRSDSSRQFLHEKMREDVEWLQSELKPVLTEDQLKKFRRRLFRSRPPFEGGTEIFRDRKVRRQPPPELFDE